MTRVMIADDSSSIRLVLEDILTIGKHEIVYQAKDGVETVEKYASLKPDILLLDLTMPKKDGLTALKEIKQIDPDAKIIMLSAADSQKMVNDCLEAGATTFIPKPFDFKIVLEKIENISKTIPL